HRDVDHDHVHDQHELHRTQQTQQHPIGAAPLHGCRHPTPLSPRTGSSVPMRPVNELSFRSEEHTSELQSRENLVCRLLLEKKKPKITNHSLLPESIHAHTVTSFC